MVWERLDSMAADIGAKGGERLDWTEIITAGIAAAGAVAGSALMQSKTTAVLKERLDALRKDVEVLSRRVDKHNGVQERVLLAECKIAELEKELKK